MEKLQIGYPIIHHNLQLHFHIIELDVALIAKFNSRLFIFIKHEVILFESNTLL
jgi:hypothetical protein